MECFPLSLQSVVAIGLEIQWVFWLTVAHTLLNSAVRSNCTYLFFYCMLIYCCISARHCWSVWHCLVLTAGTLIGVWKFPFLLTLTGTAVTLSGAVPTHATKAFGMSGGVVVGWSYHDVVANSHEHELVVRCWRGLEATAARLGGECQKWEMSVIRIMQHTAYKHDTCYSTSLCLPTIRDLCQQRWRDHLTFHHLVVYPCIVLTTNIVANSAQPGY